MVHGGNMEKKSNVVVYDNLNVFMDCHGVCRRAGGDNNFKLRHIS